MRVLGLCSYPSESAATRFRLGQYVESLSVDGIEITVAPFFDNERFRHFYGPGGNVKKLFGLAMPIFDRLRQISGVRRYDLIFVQREAMFFGPAIFEWLYAAIGRVPLVLDLDDATYVRYVSPSYGRLGSFFKFFGKTDRLIDRASVVICGNRFIAEYVEVRGTRAVVIPTVVDTNLFCPSDQQRETPVIGWIGTHSTYQFLERLFPIIRRLSARHKFTLKIVGSGRSELDLPGVDVEIVDWSLDREVSDFQGMDIGLYPIFPGGSANADWIKGKSGFKAIQYMAVGVPFVMSPVGVCAEIGEPGKTHLNAETDDDWYNSLDALLGDAGQRQRMGVEGRNYSEANFSLERCVEIMAETLKSVINNEISPHR